MVEIKTPKGKLSPGQKDFGRVWGVKMIRTTDEAIAFIQDRDKELSR
jgi:hypothetical protein